MKLETSSKSISKGKKTRQRIIQEAMYCIANYGDRDTTFQKIADRCNISQPLVVHYFKAREDIFPTVLMHALEEARSKTVKEIDRGNTAKDKLLRYFRVSFSIFRESQVSSIYLTLYYFAGFDPKYRDINTQIKQVAIKRISELLKLGIKKGEFRKINVPGTSKLIHNSLVGMLLNTITENPMQSDKQLLKTFENFVLNLLESHD